MCQSFQYYSCFEWLNSWIELWGRKIEPNLEEIKIAENILEYMLKLINKNENEFNDSEDLECDLEYQSNFEWYEEFLKENEKVSPTRRFLFNIWKNQST